MTFITGSSSEHARSDGIIEETDALIKSYSHDLPNTDFETYCQTPTNPLPAGKVFSEDPYWELTAISLIAGILAHNASCEPNECGCSEN